MDGTFIKGKTYPLKNGEPSVAGFYTSYTWNHPIRTNKDNLAQFKPYVESEYPLTADQLVPGRWYTSADWGGINAYIGHESWINHYPGMMFKEVFPSVVRSLINEVNKTEDYYKLNGTEIMEFNHAGKVQEAIDMIAGLTQN
jgi:hypothetical protein